MRLKAVDLTGQKFGRLVALFPCTNERGRRIGRCQCDCGNVVDVAAGNLRSGGTKSCGCLSHEYEDLTGRKFGRLFVIKRVPDIVNETGKHYAAWLCKCDCGNTKVVHRDNLKNNTTLSCGCLRNESASKRFSAHLEGENFGRLTVLHRVGTQIQGNGDKKSYWHCICECGSEIDIIGKNLINGNTQSCGCLISKGEEKVRKILNSLHIRFRTQYHFKDLCGPGEKGRPLKFDFAIFNEADDNLAALMEYQGEQHFSDKFGWFGKQQREVTDGLKRNYCKDHNIPLLDRKSVV